MKNMKTDLYTLFYSAGIYRHRIAGSVFLDAVEMAVEDPSRLKHITRDIYEPVARRHGSNVGRVSKNVRDVRNTIMKYGGIPFLEKLTGQECQLYIFPYPRELIEIFAGYIRMTQSPGSQF